MNRNLKFLFVLVSIALSDFIFACSTCYGDPNSDAGKGMDMAIITLLGIITPILFAIAMGILSLIHISEPTRPY